METKHRGQNYRCILTPDSFVVNPLSSKYLARYLRSKPQGIEESHVDISLCTTQSCLWQNGQEQLSNAAFFNTSSARFFSLTDVKFTFSQSKFVVFSQTDWSQFSASDASWMLLAGFLFLNWEKVAKVSQAWQQFLLKMLLWRVTMFICLKSALEIFSTVFLRWNKFVFGNGNFVFRTIAIPRSWLAKSTLVWIHCSCPALWLVSFL